MFEFSGFYFISTMIALVIMVAILTFMGTLLQHQNNATLFPANSGTNAACPDRWEPAVIGAIALCRIPANGTSADRNLGIIHLNPRNYTVLIDDPYTTLYIDPSTGGTGAWEKWDNGNRPKTSSDITTAVANGKGAISFNASTATVCDKKKWCDSFHIAWDGVSNSNVCEKAIK